MIDYFVLAITLLLLVIAYRVTKIDERLKERFPTEKEADHQWAMQDPMGHSEAHQKKESKP
jgi:hypothetical protein